MFFGPIGKTRWPPGPLIGQEIFDFSSKTTERNSTKLDRKQDVNALYKVCVFQADQKNKMAALASDWLRHFRLFLWNRWTEFSETWQEASSQCLLPCLCFSDKSGKNKMIAVASDLLRHFRLLLWNCERNSTKLDRKQDLNALYQVCVFQVDRINKMAALAIDLLRHFQLFLWNHWIEFNKTWQEARSQHSLPGLRFFLVLPCCLDHIRSDFFSRGKKVGLGGDTNANQNRHFYFYFKYSVIYRLNFFILIKHASNFLRPKTCK